MNATDDEIGVEFEERRRGGVTVRVVPLKYVITTATILFVLWNIVGIPLLDYYVTRRLMEHNRDAEAHVALVNAIILRLRTGDEKIQDKLNDIDNRLARIEGAIGVKK